MKIEKEIINIGAINFARRIDPDYLMKRDIERQVLQEIIQTYDFNIPKPFNENCNFAVHTYGYGEKSYNEVVLHYDWKAVINSGEDEKFWSWVTLVEMFNFDKPEYHAKCQQIYDTRSLIVKGNQSDVFTSIVRQEAEITPIAIQATILFPNIKTH